MYLPFVFFVFLTALMMVWLNYSRNLATLVGQRLGKNMVLHRHVCIVFLPNPPIAILELPYCLSRGWLTFLKRCYWLVKTTTRT